MIHQTLISRDQCRSRFPWHILLISLLMCNISSGVLCLINHRADTMSIENRRRNFPRNRVLIPVLVPYRHRKAITERWQMCTGRSCQEQRRNRLQAAALSTSQEKFPVQMFIHIYSMLGTNSTSLSGGLITVSSSRFVSWGGTVGWSLDPCEHRPCHPPNPLECTSRDPMQIAQTINNRM